MTFFEIYFSPLVSSAHEIAALTTVLENFVLNPKYIKQITRKIAQIAPQDMLNEFLTTVLKQFPPTLRIVQ